MDGLGIFCPLRKIKRSTTKPILKKQVGVFPIVTFSSLFLPGSAQYVYETELPSWQGSAAESNPVRTI